MDKELDEKLIKEFALKYDIWDQKYDEISYSKSVSLIQKYLYYNLVNEYEKFINEFNIIHKIDPIESTPAKLNFEYMKQNKINDLTKGVVRKYKIDNLLKNLDDNENQEDEEI